MLITLKTQTEKNFVRSSRFEKNILCYERKRIWKIKIFIKKIIGHKQK